RDFAWIVAHGHASNVEEPARFEIIRLFAKGFVEQFDGGTRAALVAMKSAGADRHEARFSCWIENTVGLFTDAELANRFLDGNRRPNFVVRRDSPFPNSLLDRLPRRQRFRRLAGFQKLCCEVLLQPEELTWVINSGDLGAQSLGALAAEEDVFRGVGLAGNFLETLGHPARAASLERRRRIRRGLRRDAEREQEEEDSNCA